MRLRACAVSTLLLTVALCCALLAPTYSASAAAATVSATDPRTAVSSEAELRAAWADPRRSKIDLTADVTLRDCERGDPIRESSYPMLVDGHGHAIRQSCFEQRLLRQDGTGYVLLRGLTLSRGGSDGPGAAVTTRGEITLEDCVVRQNLAEEPGGAVFSMRRATIIRSTMTGNLANDDGGAVYARRGGVQVYDSTLSNNLVDGSGGAVGSTGDILVIRSRVDGNTTDGDGGALYADEDGDVTVVDSTIDGNDADGPGGAIFTLDGDVAVYGSSLIGNRADDRGGAISGEADVLVVNSTIARNLAVAHVAGGAWSRGDLTAINSTITENYAEGQGGGLLAAGRVSLVRSSVLSNTASSAANVGAGHGLSSIASIIGPANVAASGDAVPTRRNCRLAGPISSAYTWVTDDTCGIAGETDFVAAGDPRLAALDEDPAERVRVPLPDSPVVDRIPAEACESPYTIPAGVDFLLSQIVDWRAEAAQDARGATRPQGAACDIGAVERVVVP